MSDRNKKMFFLSHKKSSALVVSIAIHAVFIIAALTFVAVQVYVKPEQTFEVKEVKRPTMKLRKLQVPVKERKKTQAPKLRKTIVAKPKTPTVDIKMPEIVGVKGGLGSGRSGGLGGIGFDFDMDLFGSSKGAGNEFMGTFYDLKQTTKGRPSKIGELYAAGDKKNIFGAFIEVVDTFISSGWNENRLGDYFQAPRNKYATVFKMPIMDAVEAPRAFGVEDQVKPSYWLCHYKGTIAAPETGRYRFCGMGDDVLMVRIGKKLVMDACWPGWAGKMSDWESRDPNNRKFPIGNWGTYQMVIGDWFTLTKGQPVNMEVLIGEIPGVKFYQGLLIEQEGKKYKMAQTEKGQRPVLPLFKTAELPEKLITKMKINPEQETTEGPVFGVLLNTGK